MSRYTAQLLVQRMPSGTGGNHHVATWTKATLQHWWPWFLNVGNSSWHCHAWILRSAILQPCACYVCINMELLRNMKKSMDIYVCVGIAILPSLIAGWNFAVLQEDCCICERNMCRFWSTYKNQETASYLHKFPSLLSGRPLLTPYPIPIEILFALYIYMFITNKICISHKSPNNLYHQPICFTTFVSQLYTSPFYRRH